jgi:hypothetical protein
MRYWQQDNDTYEPHTICKSRDVIVDISDEELGIYYIEKGLWFYNVCLVSPKALPDMRDNCLLNVFIVFFSEVTWNHDQSLPIL